MPSTELALVYLSRGADGGIQATEAFLKSYLQYPAGTPHQLIVITKGWSDVTELDLVKQKVSAVGGEILPLSDDGFDLGAYFRAVSLISQPYVCFLNTHSRIVSADWLAKLHRAALLPGVGAAGATGSWLSVSEPELKRWQREGAVYKIRHLQRLIRATVRYPRFPNPHLRTTAFLTTRNLFADFARTHTIPRKREQLGPIESGRRGLTAFLEKRGLAVVVAGADGRTFAPAEWPGSRTLFYPGQPNLLVSDNRTREYDMADALTRRKLEGVMWGDEMMSAGSGQA